MKLFILKWSGENMRQVIVIRSISADPDVEFVENKENVCNFAKSK